MRPSVSSFSEVVLLNYTFFLRIIPWLMSNRVQSVLSDVTSMYQEPRVSSVLIFWFHAPPATVYSCS
uniref:Uncharacterized protein n=1 Tax=Caenorhabditis japonica TaxID=281687 RepID=A0A8R1IFL6_CAEJA